MYSLFRSFWGAFVLPTPIAVCGTGLTIIWRNLRFRAAFTHCLVESIWILKDFWRATTIFVRTHIYLMNFGVIFDKNDICCEKAIGKIGLSRRDFHNARIQCERKRHGRVVFFSFLGGTSGRDRLKSDIWIVRILTNVMMLFANMRDCLSYWKKVYF